MAREREQKPTNLYPIRLDDAVVEIKVGWPALVRNTCHIGAVAATLEVSAGQVYLPRYRVGRLLSSELRRLRRNTS